MSNILFVSGSYFPYATANAVCAKKFEDALRAQGHHVIYCNRKHDLDEPDFHLVNGTEIFTVGKNSDIFFQSIGKLRQLRLPNGMHGAFSFGMKCYQLMMQLRNFGKRKSSLRQEAREMYLDEYAEKIREVIAAKKIDLIISVSMPFDSHCAVLRAMHAIGEIRPKWIAYCIDAYWSKAGVNPGEVPAMKKEEREIFQYCDHILMLDTIEKDYAGNEFAAFRTKITSLPLPLFDLQSPLEDCSAEGIETREDVSEIVFTGTVYDDFSNIDAFIDVAREFQGEKIRFHFLGKIYPKSLANLRQLQQSMPGKLEIYGRMPYPYAQGSMQRADVLLNLANDNANQIPSKIFQYMMCRKPVLNIYRMEEDVGTMYLKKYPLAFNFDCKRDLVAQCQQLREWLQKAQSLSTTMKELDACFHEVTSAVVCDKFCDLCNTLLGK